MNRPNTTGQVDDVNDVEKVAARVPKNILTVTLTSVTPDETGEQVLRQRVTLDEFSDDAQEHIKKNFGASDGIAAAFRGMAKKAGFETE